MGESAYTTGPWFPHFNGLYFTIDVGPGEYDPAVAHVYLSQVLHTSKDDAEAIARLISAAPELIECLKDARRLLTDQDAIDLEYVDTVIAKAEGTVSRAETVEEDELPYQCDACSTPGYGSDAACHCSPATEGSAS